MSNNPSERTRFRAMLGRILSEKLPEVPLDDLRVFFGSLIPAEKLAGMTYEELMMRQLVLKACAGNDKSITEIMDRVAGKPTQVIEGKVLTGTYQDFLAECDKRDRDGLQHADIIDVDPVAQPETDILRDLL